MAWQKEYMRDISTIDQMWLAELAPHYFSFKNKNIKTSGIGDPDAEMFEEGTHKRRRLGPVRLHNVDIVDTAGTNSVDGRCSHGLQSRLTFYSTAPGCGTIDVV